jgi:hypothetical protein
MADLLECLLQIKALSETARRVSEMAARWPLSRWTASAGSPGPSAVSLIEWMAEAERRDGEWLHAMLTLENPGLAIESRPAFISEGASPEQGLERFAALRRANLELLGSCDAEMLSRPGILPPRGRITVADMVALMLARDVDSTGRLREMLEPPGPHAANQGAP